MRVAKISSPHEWVAHARLVALLLILASSESEAALGRIRVHRRRTQPSKAPAAERLGDLNSNRDGLAKDAQFGKLSSKEDGRAWSDLPRLAWVVSQSADQLGPWSESLSALNCYCAQHGIPLYYETETRTNDSRPFLFRRLSNVQKYLPYFQWVLHTDLDVLAVNHSVNAADFLDDSFDLILNDRIPPYSPAQGVQGTPELHSSAFFVKNSEHSRSFLQRWISTSDNDRYVFSNEDNGELHEVILQSLSMQSCLSKGLLDERGYVLPGTYRKYLQCFRNAVKSAVSDDLNGSPWYGIGSSSHNEIAIKVYRILAGFHRDAQGDVCPGEVNVACRFLPGDFLLHGKSLRHIISPDLMQCTSERTISSEETNSSDEFNGGEGIKNSDGTNRDNFTVDGGGAGRESGESLLHGAEKEAWLSLEQARDAVTAAGLTTYSGCWEDGVDVCAGRSVQGATVGYPFHDRFPAGRL